MAQRHLPELIEHAIDAAFAAGREILRVYAGEFEVHLKNDRSPLTEADRKAHVAIEEVLSVTSLPILSEEGSKGSPEERRDWEMYWLVDPLDGTKEFVKRNGEFTVNIALMQRDPEGAEADGISIPIGGVLYVPVTDLLYFGWHGAGSYRQENAATFRKLTAYDRAAMSSRLPMSGTVRSDYTIVSSRSHLSAETEAFIRRKREENKDVQITSIGSALKICLVAEGTADVYPRFGPTMEWDTAAGHAICLGAGKQITDVKTNAPMRYNKKDLMNNWFIVQ